MYFVSALLLASSALAQRYTTTLPVRPFTFAFEGYQLTLCSSTSYVDFSLC